MGNKRDGKGYCEHLHKFPFNQYKFAVVIVHDPRHKNEIKSLLDKNGIPSQFILSITVDRAKITVYSNVLKQINAKLRQDLYKIQTDSKMAGSMIVGVDIVAAGRSAIIGMTASYSKHFTQHYAQVER